MGFNDPVRRGGGSDLKEIGIGDVGEDEGECPERERYRGKREKDKERIKKTDIKNERMIDKGRQREAIKL